MAPLTNTEKFYQDRYAEAHAWLVIGSSSKSPDIQLVNRAENKFTELLNEPHIPFWMRTQCNAILASITDETSHANQFLASAQENLGYYIESRKLDNDELTDDEEKRVGTMQTRLTQIKSDIVARDQQEDAALLLTPRAAPRSAQDIQDDAEMLLGPELEYMQESAARSAQDMHDDEEMLLGPELEYMQESAARSAQDMQDDEEMLLGPEIEHMQEPATRSAQDMQDDAEMLLGPEIEHTQEPATRSAQDLQDDEEMLLGPEIEAHDSLGRDVQQLALDSRSTTSSPTSRQTYESSRGRMPTDTDMSSQISDDERQSEVKKEDHAEEDEVL